MRLLFALLALLFSPLAGGFFLVVGRPSRPMETAGSIRSVWRGRPNRLASFPYLAEGDLLRLAAMIISHVDPLMSREHARRMRAMLFEDACNLPDLLPAWPETLRALFTWKDDSRQLFVIEPNDHQPPLGLMIFLHGHGGNSVLYAHLLQDWATQHRLLIVCPSFGYGNWESPKGVQAVRGAIAYARGHCDCDTSRLYIAGISQGGAGVVRAARELGSSITGVILISPTMEPGQLTAPWNGMPALVIQGDADHNVTPGSVKRGVELLRNAGTKVTFQLMPGEDHFLFFARRREVSAMVGEWLR